MYMQFNSKMEDYLRTTWQLYVHSHQGPLTDPPFGAYTFLDSNSSPPYSRST